MALHEKVLSNGSPETYKEWSSCYEEDSMQLGYVGHKSVVSKWLEYCSVRTNSSKHKIFDAGCGTGFVGDALASAIPSFSSTIELYGGDLSPDMLSIADSKLLYKDLRTLNLKERLPYNQESFDSVLCAGVFVQGHCGPESLSNMTQVLKRDCFLIATIRVEFYNENKGDWLKEIHNCDCQLVEEIEMPYRPDVQGIVLVIKK